MDNLKTYLNEIIKYLQRFPIWLRTVLLLLLAALLLVMSTVSCGPVVRVKITGTRDGVNVSTTQSSSDSSALNIHVNPTLNFDTNGK